MGGMRFGRTQAVRVQRRDRIAVKKLARNIGLLTLLLVGVFALAPGSASAEPLCTDTWTGPVEGNWTTAEDWSTGKAPTSTDVACIGAEKTVSLTEGANKTGVLEDKETLAISGGSLEVANALEASSASVLTLSGGTLSLAGTLEVTSSLAVGNAGVSGAGRMVVKSGASAPAAMSKPAKKLNTRRKSNATRRAVR